MSAGSARLWNARAGVVPELVARFRPISMWVTSQRRDRSGRARATPVVIVPWPERNTVAVMIIVTAAIKGGVGKTTTAVYLAALASSNRRTATLIDADPSGSAADWIENHNDERLDRVEIVEAPTERLLTKALDKIEPGATGIVDPPPSHERLVNKAIERARVIVIPTRIGGVEMPRVESVLEMIPDGTPYGLVICSARTYTRSYAEAVQAWSEAGVPIWGTVPERVAITAGPTGPLSYDGLEAYKKVWRKVLAAARS
jgi:chromosome partitioning protein